MRRTVPALVASALAAALTTAPATGPASAAEEAPLYVAMGDSYSAASGVVPPDPEATIDCARSLRNYPHVIASMVDVRLRDVTCGAAETNDYFQNQYPDVPPQLDALTRRTRLVTMTIGGNDQGVFIDAILSCGTEGLTTAGLGSPCKEEYGDSFVRKIREKTAPALERALRAVHRRAENAEIAILGYPWIMPPEDGCYPQMPVAEGDVPYLRNIQAVLNRAVRRAADATGTTFVDFDRVSEGHDACQEIGVRWIEPVVGTTNPVIVHPNALGERRMARRTIRRLDLEVVTDPVIPALPRPGRSG